MTRYEQILNGTKEDLAIELVEVARWARHLSSEEWTRILWSKDGMEKFMLDMLDAEVK